MHDVRFSLFEVPASQFVQYAVLAFGAIVPGGQMEHNGSPYAADVPGKHGSHAKPSALGTVPGSQETHALAPSPPSEILPLAQSKHSSTPPRLNDPVAQSTQAV